MLIYISFYVSMYLLIRNRKKVWNRFKFCFVQYDDNFVYLTYLADEHLLILNQITQKLEIFSSLDLLICRENLKLKNDLFIYNLTDEKMNNNNIEQFVNYFKRQFFRTNSLYGCIFVFFFSKERVVVYV